MNILLVLLVLIVVLAIVGWAVFGLVFTLLWWGLIGLFIGALARLVLPGRQPIGGLATAGSGVAGALLGGIIANAAEVGSVIQFIIAILVAAVVVTLVDRAQASAQPS